MATHFVLIGLVVSSALSYAWPGLTGGGFDPFLASAAWLWPLIALAMFAVGWLLPGDELRLVASRWPVVLAGTALQYTAMPVLAYVGGRLAGLEGDLLVGVILVGCVPGAMASNVLTLLARGNVSYSVCLTTTATLISPLVVPFALAVALGRQDVTFPRGQTMRDLFAYVVLPVLSGHLLGRWLVRWERWARPIGNMLANLVILWIIAVVVAANRDAPGRVQPASDGRFTGCQPHGLPGREARGVPVEVAGANESGINSRNRDAECRAGHDPGPQPVSGTSGSRDSGRSVHVRLHVDRHAPGLVLVARPAVRRAAPVSRSERKNEL